jgi:hypothetical protein
MKIVGVDLHAKQQSIAMLDTETGELTEKLIRHEGNVVREFYVGLEGPGVVGGLGSHRVDAVVFGVAGRAGNPISGRSSGEDPGGRAPETET